MLQCFSGDDARCTKFKLMECGEGNVCSTSTYFQKPPSRLMGNMSEKQLTRFSSCWERHEYLIFFVCQFLSLSKSWCSYHAVAKICYTFFEGQLYDFILFFSRTIPEGDTKITAVTQSLHCIKVNVYYSYY